MKNSDERIVETQATAARWTQHQGGDRIAQETAAIYAKNLLAGGKSAATAIDKAVKAGLRMQQRINKAATI